MERLGQCRRRDDLAPGDVSVVLRQYRGREFQLLPGAPFEFLCVARNAPHRVAVQLREKSMAYVAGLTPTSKAERMRTVLELCLAGKRIDAIVTVNVGLPRHLLYRADVCPSGQEAGWMF
jgi:hypothetical protein